MYLTSILYSTSIFRPVHDRRQGREEGAEQRAAASLFNNTDYSYWRISSVVVILRQIRQIRFSVVVILLRLLLILLLLLLSPLLL